VGYVWQKNQLLELGRQRKLRENRLSALDEQNEKLKNALAVMHRPGFLEQRIKELNLGLMPPQPSQVWRLPEPGKEPVKPVERERQYAVQEQ
jgi:hypothetical protein